VWLKSRDPKFLGKRFEVSSKLFELETSNLVLSFVNKSKVKYAKCSVNSKPIKGIVRMA